MEQFEVFHAVAGLVLILGAYFSWRKFRSPREFRGWIDIVESALPHAAVIVSACFCLLFLLGALGALFAWFRGIDALLDPSLFATLAGLALAASALMAGVVATSRERVRETRELIKRTPADYNDDVLIIRELIDETPRPKTLEDNGLTPTTQRHIEISWEHNDAKGRLEYLSGAQSRLVVSFYWLVAGLVGSLTLDVVSNAQDHLVGTVEAAGGLVNLRGMELIALLDVALSATCISLGVAYLCLGSLSLRLGSRVRP